MRTRREPTSEARPVPRPEAILPELATVDTSAERYQLAIKALAEGRISLREADLLTRILERGLAVADAAIFEARICAAEQKALAAARLAGARALPASQATIEVPRGE